MPRKPRKSLLPRKPRKSLPHKPRKSLMPRKPRKSLLPRKPHKSLLPHKPRNLCCLTRAVYGGSLARAAFLWKLTRALFPLEASEPRPLEASHDSLPQKPRIYQALTTATERRRSLTILLQLNSSTKLLSNSTDDFTFLIADPKPKAVDLFVSVKLFGYLTL